MSGPIVTIWDKPLLTRRECMAVMPGTGEGMFKSLARAGKLQAVDPTATRPVYSSRKLRELLDAIERGEA